MDFPNFNFNNNAQNPKINFINQNNNNNGTKQQASSIEDNENKKNFSFNRKPFNIKESHFNIYIENVNQLCTIKIPKSFDNKIFIVDNQNELMNINPIKTYQADSIIGIFDLNDNKYLGIVTSSTQVANIFDYCIYNIKSIQLIKITYNNYTITDLNVIKFILYAFSCSNFYYSNNYDISLSLYNQSIKNNVEGNSNFINSKYIINSSLLKYFLENNIPEYFFCPIIFGYIGCQKDLYLNQTINLDIILIERFFNKNLIINKDVPGYIKQTELICLFKNKDNKKLDKTFSYVCYHSSETLKIINKFFPFKSNLIEEFALYNNIICIINNVNKVNDNIKINESMMNFNKNLLNNKISIFDYTSDWNNDLLFDTNYDSNKYIDIYLNESKDYLQQNVFWLIDINNPFFNDDVNFNALSRVLCNAIQKEINYIGKDINLGPFVQNNNNVIYIKFYELLMKCKNDLHEHKKPLLLRNREKNQEIIDKFFSYAHNYDDNFNNIQLDYDNKDNEIEKINILCVTWNIAGIPNKNYNIKELFSNNIFYNEFKSPDIIIVAIQEIVKLNIPNILSIVSNQDSVNSWTINIKSTIQKVFPSEEYLELKSLNLVGIFIIILIKDELKKNIFLLEHNITKTGMYGTLGNKGFFNISFQCYNKIISIGTGHFEAGKSKNTERINTLIQLLNKPLNIQEDEIITFKDVNYWIILGDLNFRIELSYEDAIKFIQEKNYDKLYGLDQLNIAMEKNEFLRRNINEKKIHFDPTYKYEKESDEYDYDEDKIRVPAWTDRILFCKKGGIKMLSYDCIQTLRYSDHRPVIGTFEILVHINKKKKKKDENKENNNNNKNEHNEIMDNNNNNDNEQKIKDENNKNLNTNNANSKKTDKQEINQLPKNTINNNNLQNQDKTFDLINNNNPKNISKKENNNNIINFTNNQESINNNINNNDISNQTNNNININVDNDNNLNTTNNNKNNDNTNDL